MRILHVVGARPNFVKVAPVLLALSKHSGVRQLLVHTGQHYDINMSDVFFHELDIPKPDINLGVGSGSHAQQTAQIMSRIEPVLLQDKPEWVLVYGDVNSTVATALVCAKLHIPVAHVEAGLRSGDRTMPEEINRLLTDQIADLLFTPSADADANLRREGVAEEKIYCVGNVMIDTLVRLQAKVTERNPLAKLGFGTDALYALVTIHRPANVDDPEVLKNLMHALDAVSVELPVIFAVHPRTRRRMQALGLIPNSANFHLIEPVGYLDFLALQKNARVVITDSGGIQEETTYMGIPCLTIRNNTERPITTGIGTNRLIGQETVRLHYEVKRILAGDLQRGQIPPLWDGNAAHRLAAILVSYQR